LKKIDVFRFQENECHLKTTRAREVGLVSFCRGASGISFAYLRYIGSYQTLRNYTTSFETLAPKRQINLEIY
jgi:hypothetical protein